MKRITVLLIIAGLLSCACSSKLSKTGTKEKDYVGKFLALMDHNQTRQYDKMMACISKKYIKDNSINTSEFKVDNYTIWGYSIESYDSKTGFIKAKVWGQDRKWVHMLTFKMVNEGGKLYLWPSKADDGYIDPWWEVETYIRE